MRFLLEPAPTTELDVLTEAARAAHAAGLDGVLLREAPELPAPLLAVAALSARVGDIRLAAEISLGRRHPLELAEEAAVVDVTCGGRLLLVVRPESGAEDRFDEALDLLRVALSARPFRFEGRHWQVPANLPENVHGRDEQVRLMPPPAQLRLEIWGAGEGARDSALARGLGYLAARDEEPAPLAAALERSAEALGPAVLGALRARRERLDTPEELVARLRAGRTAFGQDCAVVEGGPDTAAVLGGHVAPRVQLNRLPVGLEEFWDGAGR